MEKTLSIFAVSVVFSLLLLQVVVPTTVLGVGGVGDTGIVNPLSVDTLQDLITLALTFVANILAVAGAFYIIWTGFLFVKAQGNPKEIETAKKSFFNAIIGMAIILGAMAISYIIRDTINGITNNNQSALDQS